MSASAWRWEFPARLVRVIDGDTLVVEADLGFHTRLELTVRLLGVNAPELRGRERAAGRAAREYAAQWLAERAGAAWPLVLRPTAGRPVDRYGRYLAVVRDQRGESLNDAMQRWVETVGGER